MKDSNLILKHRINLINEVRSLSAIYTEFTYHFAVWLKLHQTDALALTEILFAEDLGVLLSPARLAEKISLSSGAMTASLDRLESAGYVLRSRESSDRRIVTLRSSPGIREPAIKFFGLLGEHVDAFVSEHSEKDILKHESFMKELRISMQSALDEQKVTPEP